MLGKPTKTQKHFYEDGIAKAPASVGKYTVCDNTHIQKPRSIPQNTFMCKLKLRLKGYNVRFNCSGMFIFIFITPNSELYDSS